MMTGLLASKLDIIKGEAVKKLTSLVVNITNPCFILSSVIGDEVVDKSELLLMTGISISMFAILIFIAVFLPVILRVPKKSYGVYRAMLVFNNLGFMGAPIISGIYGSKALLLLVTFILPFNVLIYTYGVAVIKDDEHNVPIRLLLHESTSGWDNMKKLHDKWVAEGFEGAVITDPSKPYKVGSRCNNLIKIKQYKSEDFKVIGYKLGLRGSEDMTFTCELEDGRTFEAMPVGNREIKAEYVENFETKYKGHKAECTFFNYSDDGIPTQPKLRIFRFDLE